MAKKNKTQKLEFTQNEIKLLMSILKDAEEERGNMGCNDAYDNEEKLLSKKERVDYITKQDEYDKEDLKEVLEDGAYMSNSDYVNYMIQKIKTQI